MCERESERVLVFRAGDPLCSLTFSDLCLWYWFPAHRLSADAQYPLCSVPAAANWFLFPPSCLFAPEAAGLVDTTCPASCPQPEIPPPAASPEPSHLSHQHMGTPCQVDSCRPTHCSLLDFRSSIPAGSSLHSVHSDYRCLVFQDWGWQVPFVAA